MRVSTSTSYMLFDVCGAAPAYVSKHHCMAACRSICKLHTHSVAHPTPLQTLLFVSQAEERALLDDVFMAPKERELNRRLLSAARSALDSVSRA